MQKTLGSLTLILLTTFAWTTSLSAAESSKNFRITSPGGGATVLGASVPVRVEGCECRGPGELRLKIDGRPVPAQWKQTYPHTWEATAALSGEGLHQLEVESRCRHSLNSKTVRFQNQKRGALEIARAVADHSLASKPVTRLSWDWGPAVLLHGLTRLGYWEDVRAYHEHWIDRGIPTPNRSDSCPPALSGLALWRHEQDAVGLPNATRIVRYIQNEPRNSLGALNHLGHWFVGKLFYRNSIWVDSLMMYALLAVQWGKDFHDRELLEFGAAQPGIFARVLQDPKTGLFRHAWRVEAAKPIPTSETYWLRGNGWVLVSIAEILEELPESHPRRPELLSIFVRLSEALARHQMENGLWDTIANLPGEAYAETSGSALVSYAYARGSHRGWLSKDYLDRSKRAFAAIAALLEARDHGYSMPEISAATNPSPRWLYRAVPRVSDASYGVGPFLLAGHELKDEIFN